MDKRVVVFSQGGVNIGDAFVTLGLEYIMKKTIGNSEIYVIGSPYSSMGYLSERFWYNILRKLIPSKIRENIVYRITRETVSNVFEYIKYLNNIDYIVLGGCILTHYFVRKDLRFLLEIKDKTKILLIGVGGEVYTRREIEESKKFLSKLKPHLIVTRDPAAYQLYNKYATYSWDGIDNAFFVSDAFKPPKLNLKYIIVNFDHISEPQISNPNDLPIVRMHNLTKGIPKKWLKQENIFISDYPEDYLTIIANAEYIHTDRIHTAIVAEAYNRPYKYYGKSYKYYGKNVRTKILEKIKDKDLDSEKRKELDFIREVISHE